MVRVEIEAVGPDVDRAALPSAVAGEVDVRARAGSKVRVKHLDGVAVGQGPGAAVVGRAEET